MRKGNDGQQKITLFRNAWFVYVGATLACLREAASAKAGRPK
jgi:hypothetical protein